jgi:hypothetical protein
VFYDEPARVVPWQVRTGHSFNPLLLYKCIGVFKDQAAVNAYPHWTGAKPGDLIFEDVSNDYKITADDKILLDFWDAPEISYGVSLNATWKGFALSVLIQGQGKYMKFNRYDEVRGEGGNYFKWEYNGRWTPENPSTTMPRAYSRNDLYWSPGPYGNYSTFYYDNVAYCRLKNLVLTYTIPKQLYKRFGFSRASIYFSGNNLALLYSATDKFDPEVDGQGVYPAMKTFAIGANITF